MFNVSVKVSDFLHISLVSKYIVGDIKSRSQIFEGNREDVLKLYGNCDLAFVGIKDSNTLNLYIHLKNQTSSNESKSIVNKILEGADIRSTLSESSALSELPRT